MKLALVAGILMEQTHVALLWCSNVVFGGYCCQKCSVWHREHTRNRSTMKFLEMWLRKVRRGVPYEKAVISLPCNATLRYIFRFTMLMKLKASLQKNRRQNQRYSAILDCDKVQEKLLDVMPSCCSGRALSQWQMGLREIKTHG